MKLKYITVGPGAGTANQPLSAATGRGVPEVPLQAAQLTFRKISVLQLLGLQKGDST